MIYCITANAGGTSMDSLFNSMNKRAVINKGALCVFMFSKFLPTTTEGFKKPFQNTWLWNL